VLAAPRPGEPPGSFAKPGARSLGTLDPAQRLFSLRRVIFDGFVAFFSAHAVPFYA